MRFNSFLLFSCALNTLVLALHCSPFLFSNSPALNYVFGGENFRTVLSIRQFCVAMMLRGASSGLYHANFGWSYLRDGGIVGNGIGHFINLRVNKSSPSGFNSRTILSVGGRRHHRRREGSVNAKKQHRGDDTVQITLDFDELKLRAGEAAVTTKKALVSSVGNVRQVRTISTLDADLVW